MDRNFHVMGRSNLLYLLEIKLNQPATQLFQHNFTGIRGTNTLFEQVDIFQRLDIWLLEIQPGNTDGDIFSLNYKVGRMR